MKKNRIFSVILSVVMLLSVILPVTVFADEAELMDEDVVVESATEAGDDEIIVEEVADDTEPVVTEAEVLPQETETQGEEFDETVAAVVSVMIVAQPVDYEVEVGGNATFHVEAVGAESYQWQFHNGKIWQNTSSTGATTDTITVVCNATRYNYKYRCILTGNDGSTLTTDEVKMVKPSSSFIEDNVKYAIIDKENVSVEKYLGTGADTVTIPETVRGYTVIEIGAKAFEGKTEIVTVHLPDTIKVIGYRAFAGCTSLANMD